MCRFVNIDEKIRPHDLLSKKHSKNTKHVMKFAVKYIS
jgi:hypothetical protein